MIKTSVILFVLFYLVSAHSQQTIDKLNSNQLKLPKETISKALSIDATGQVKSSATSDTELGYLSGVTSAIQDQINDKANDVDAVHLTGDESISGVKTLTGKLVTSSTVNASIPCPVMTQTQRDAIATPSVGDCVFNSDTSLSNIYDGALWKAMGGSGGGIGLWVTANGYAVDDVVIESNNIYICLTAHTSGTFATDLSSLYWLRLSTDVTGATGLLPLATGGTNKSITASDGSIVYSDSDSLELLSPGTSGQILQTNGAAAPTFVNKSISGKAQNTTSVTIEEIQVPNNLLTATDTNKYLNETGNTNILSNPSFEHSTFSTSWTNVAGTFTQELTSVIDGKASAKLVLSAQAVSLTQSSTLYASQFADGVQGLASVRIKSDIAVKVCSIQAGTVSTTNCVTTNTDLKWGLYKLPFILGGTSNGISISTNGTLVTGTVIVDDAFVGAVDLKQDINNIGPWTSFTPTGSWTANSPVYVGKYRQVGESMEIKWELTLGGAVTVSELGLNIPPGFTIDTAKALSIATNSPFGYAKILDAGSNVYDAVVVGSTSSTSVIVRATGAGGTYTTAGTVLTATVPMTWASGDKVVAFASIPVTQFSGSSSVYTSNNSDTDWASCGHTTSDFTGFGTVTGIDTQCKRQGGDLLMKGNFTPGTTTAVEARVNLKLGGVTLTSGSSARLPSISVAGLAVRASQTTTYFAAVPLIEPLVSYVTWGLQTSTTNGLTKILGTSVGATAFSFSVRIPINGWEQSNIIIGQFNGLQSCTDTLACTDTFSAQASIAGVVTSENIDWINGNGSLSSSVYTYTFKTGIFTVPPTCVTNLGTSSGSSRISSVTSTTVSVTTTNTAFGLADRAHDIVCQKQGADYIGKTAMAVASDQNLRTPGVTDGIVYSGVIGASGGAVSSEVGDLINGSCSGTTTKTCTLNSGAIDSGNCTCSVSGSFGECRIGLTSSTITVLTSNSAGIAADVAVNYICHGVKQ